MFDASKLDSIDIATYLKEHEDKSMLRFITCGSVDDGKSTLIGRMLYESKLVFDDQLSSLERDSKKMGTQGDDLDFALLVDGLASEREQGITIDVAYRFFATNNRKFIVADTPGHEQYTRNMATGASNADLAIILIDARKGILTQSRRHSLIISLLGIKHVILAINKMDLVGYEQDIAAQIDEDYRNFAKKRCNFETITTIPMSALKGDNIVNKSTSMKWYKGSSLLELLDTIDVQENHEKEPFRMPVQWVNRPNLDFRGFSGRICGGIINVGDEVVVYPSKKTSIVSQIVTMDGDLPHAVHGQSVTLVLKDEIDVSRGDIFVKTDSPIILADQFQVHMLWMDEQPMLPGRSYLMKMAAQTTSITITTIKYGIDINSAKHLAITDLKLNQVAVCNIATSKTIGCDPYQNNHDTGGFVLIDKMTNATVGMGMIDFPLHRATNIKWHDSTVESNDRAAIKNQQPLVLWFTGLSGSGKSTIANLVDKGLTDMAKHTMLLDGDNIRHGLNKDLGFTNVDRVENIRRISEVSKLMCEAGLIVLVSFISPFRSERELARSLQGEKQFIEIFIDTSLEVAESRDVKGLYAKARNGELSNFTGIDSPYEKPEKPEIWIDTSSETAMEAADRILRFIEDYNV